MTNVEPSGDEQAQVREATKLLELRASADRGMYDRLVLERRISGLPEHIVKAAKVGLTDGSETTSLENGDNDEGLPSLSHLSAMEQTLLEGALEKTTIDAAVLQIYENMHTKTGWKYNASVSTVSGTAYITGETDVGMCESYRNAFGAILKVYDALRPSHPDDAIKNGVLEIKGDDSLAADRFYTREGLTLMGGLQGNVYLQVDGQGGILARGANSINRFVFKGHWTSKVNGKVFDPIFYSIDEANVDGKVDENYMLDGARFIPNTKLPVPSGEFGATFVWVTDWEQFEETVKAMKTLYDANAAEIDEILSGQKTIKQGRGGKNRRCYTQAVRLVKERVANMTIFNKVAQDSTQVLRASQITAVGKIIDLAAKSS